MSNDHPLNPTRKDDIGGSPSSDPLAPTNPSARETVSRTASGGSAAGLPSSDTHSAASTMASSSSRLSSEQELPNTAELTGEKLKAEARETVRNLSDPAAARSDDQSRVYSGGQYPQSLGDRNTHSVRSRLGQYTRDQPVLVLGAAAVLGFLLVRLTRTTTEPSGRASRRVPGFARDRNGSLNTSSVNTSVVPATDLGSQRGAGWPH